MKSTTTKLMITAAALAFATGVASAQTLQADIPFAFRAGDKVMAPGTYQVKANEARQYVIISNYETKQSVIVLAIAQNTPPANWTAKGEAVMSFECGASRCELTKLWNGLGYNALAFRRHEAGRYEQAFVTEIRLARVNGD
ncbi:MAG TPA: hypothetical protein VMS37_07540 [Verrucomicrobiae bacterium]|nr:hypothetical protein [Verrucomicrobiae bacterium]